MSTSGGSSGGSGIGNVVSNPGLAYTASPGDFINLTGQTTDSAITLPANPSKGTQVWVCSGPNSGSAVGQAVIEANTGQTINNGQVVVELSDGDLPLGGPFVVLFTAISTTAWITTSAVNTDTASSSPDGALGGNSISGPVLFGSQWSLSISSVNGSGGTYTLQTTDLVLDCVGTSSTIDLLGAGSPRVVMIVNRNSYRTLVPTGTTTTIAALSQLVMPPGSSVLLVQSSSNWDIVASSGFGYGNLYGLVGGALVKATATHTALPGENTLCTANTFTVTLPATLTTNARNRVSNGGAGVITVAPGTGTLTSLAAATGNMTLAAGTSAEYMNDGTNYFQVA